MMSAIEKSKRGNKNVAINVGDEEFALLKVNIDAHPLIDQSYEVRKWYMTALYGLVKNIKCPILSEYINIYFAMLNIAETDKNRIIDLKAEEFQYAIKQVTKFRYRVKMGLFNRWSGKNVLFADTLYIANFCSENLSAKEIAELGKWLKVKKTSIEMIKHFCSSIRQNALDDAKQYYIKACKRDKNAEYIYFLLERAQKRMVSEQLGKFAVAVVGSMGAGKSTFLNALIGRDLFPSQNMACTSKCASIVDNDFLGYNHVIGRCQRDNGSEECIGVITNKTIANWNDDPQVVDIKLECNLQGILNNRKAIVLHDTPGTNFSQDPSHRNNTYDFLEKTQLNLIIYLINATNIASDDDYFLLKKISDLLSEKPNTGILFVINKLDEYDLEKDDDISVTLDNLQRDLTEMGFQNPNIIPVSAYAAKLFKMALHGIPLTQKEAIDFERLYKTFHREAYNLNHYALVKHKLHEKRSNKITNILVNENKYLNNQVYEALEKTGIPLVESHFNELV